MTLLALGNGAPDIFSAFAAISQTDDHKSSLAIGALFGELKIKINNTKTTNSIFKVIEMTAS